MSNKHTKPETANSRLRDIEIELTAYVSDESKRESLMEMLKMFYRAAIKSQVGIAEALNTETGEEELILVGIERTMWGTEQKYPLARLLNVDELDRYKIPGDNLNDYPANDLNFPVPA